MPQPSHLHRNPPTHPNHHTLQNRSSPLNLSLRRDLKSLPNLNNHRAPSVRQGPKNLPSPKSPQLFLSKGEFVMYVI